MENPGSVDRREYIQNYLENNSEIVAAIVCGVCVLLGWVFFQNQQIAVSTFFWAIAYPIGGYGSTKEGLTTLLEEKELDVDLLMVVAALGAATLGWWQQDSTLVLDGALLILIFATSGALESIALQQTEKNIRSLMELTPETARRQTAAGEVEIVAVADLRVGDRLLIAPGEAVPTDATIVEGTSQIDRRAITGEAQPVWATAGMEVFGGTINGNGALTAIVSREAADRLLQRIVDLVRTAQTETPPSQAFIEKFERQYAKFIVIAGVCLGTLPPFIWGWDWETTIYRMLIFLVVASPCALAAAIVPVLLSGIATGARQGILFKGGSKLESLGDVAAIAFDKTGTLTTGELTAASLWHPSLAKPLVFDDSRDIDGLAELSLSSRESLKELISLAAAIEGQSNHPIGRAIVRLANSFQVASLEDLPKEVVAEPGKGIIGKIGNEEISIGSESILSVAAKADLEIYRSRIPELTEVERTIVWIATQTNILGAITFTDTIRPEAAATIATLQAMGITCVMVTGDSISSAQKVAKNVGIKEVCAELLPEEKMNFLGKLKERFAGTIVMVGDGINDAPALACADVGIAMGVTGTDIALETADVVLVGDDLSKIHTAIELGKRTRRIAKQNITLALTSIAVLLCANAGGSIDLPTGVFGHEGSTVLVTLSGLRLLSK
jgi:Zn2+/Cd2+-exporting ATPase